jgi:hypothetical protein
MRRPYCMMMKSCKFDCRVDECAHGGWERRYKGADTEREKAWIDLRGSQS